MLLFQVYKFNNLTNGQIAHLNTYNQVYNFDMWSPERAELMHPGQDANIHVSAEHIADFEAQLAEFDIEFELMTSNLQHDIDLEKLYLARDDRAHSLTNYNDYATVKTYFQGLGNQAGAQYRVYGTTHEGLELFALEVGSGSKVNLGSYISIKSNFLAH